MASTVRTLVVLRKSLSPDKHYTCTYSELYQSVIFLQKQCRLLVSPLGTPTGRAQTEHKHVLSPESNICFNAQPVSPCVSAAEALFCGTHSSDCVSACNRTPVPASSAGALVVQLMKLGDLGYSLFWAENSVARCCGVVWGVGMERQGLL